MFSQIGLNRPDAVCFDCEVIIKVRLPPLQDQDADPPFGLESGSYPAFFRRFRLIKVCGSTPGAYFFRNRRTPVAASYVNVDRAQPSCFAQGRLVWLRFCVLLEAALQDFHQIDDLGRLGDCTRRCG